ncbi:golgin subfamily a member 6-like protein 2 protein [Lasius niger]|uniref:Golgin subfamily a member 6-like protein 2 protein n=1 Tax=Lasius niger TaxID=67767 RepID=A0A0J7NAI5_LASNI|nr:golgin subfamily a member 6-like protein 2 protein [Lasius niger]
MLNKRRDGNRSKIVLVKLEEWEDKRKIMEKKKELYRGIYIEDDLTWKEREVQKNLRDLASEHKKSGKSAKVGYFKLCVDGKWLRWNERRGSLREEEERRARQGWEYRGRRGKRRSRRTKDLLLEYRRTKQ